jgi:DNA repair protein RecN (Recombination protein N)
MLSLLHIENIAVIELGDIAFDGRLNVLTGETGAGKSIIIDSISALLGQRTSRDLIRSGHDTALVGGVFCPPGGEELLLERELREDGRNLCKAGGKPITLANLRELGDGLVNIHGQHDSQALLREETHINYLDVFAALSLDEYDGLYRKWTGLCAERKSLSVAEDEKMAKINLLTNRLEELRELDLKPGEEDYLTNRRKTLRNAWQIREYLNEAYYTLYGDEEARGACDLVSEAARAISSAAANAPEMAELAAGLEELQYTLRDCAEEARGFHQGMESSEEELEQVETRLDAVNRLRRKHNMEPDALLKAAESWAAELGTLEYAEGRLLELEKEISIAESALLDEAAKLTKKRGEAALTLSARVEEELSGLDMGKTRLSIRIEQVEPKDDGCDSVAFLIATNVGEECKPLAKIASGGEMARIMLALKNILAEGDAVNTLVFDEVDSGVSGQAAQRVARKLCEVSRRKQVLCVTHLPQIAAFADSHFHVEKAVEGGRTVTRVTKLTRAERVEELARITAGASVTDAARRAAEELLEMAEGVKNTFSCTPGKGVV